MSENNEFNSVDELMSKKVQTQQAQQPTAEAHMGQDVNEQPSQDVTNDTAITDKQVEEGYNHYLQEHVSKPQAAQQPQVEDRVEEKVQSTTSPVTAQHQQEAIIQVPRNEDKKYQPTANESDLANIQFADTADLSSLDVMKAINTAVNHHSGAGTFRAVALKSGYAFEVEPLRFAEIERLINTVGDTHSEQVKLIKTVYSKIKWFSCGHLSYTDFINCTAYDDFDTILYALYSITYAGTNKYPIKCQNCGEENNIEVSVDKLISKVDEEKLLRVRKVLEQATIQGEKIDTLPLEMRERLKLNSSGILVEYGVSSIGDFLAGLSRMQNSLVDPKTGKMDTNKAEITSMIDFELSVDYMYIPVPNENRYIRVSDKSQINSILTKLSHVDGPQFKQHLQTLREKYRIDYSIPKFNCAHCGHESPELNLNFEQLLFTEMNRESES